MASKTRIIILRMKEILYALIFIVMVMILLVLFIYMFSVRRSSSSQDPSQPTTYTSDISSEEIQMSNFHLEHSGHFKNIA